MLTMTDPRHVVIRNTYDSKSRVIAQVVDPRSPGHAGNRITHWKYTGDNTSAVGGTTTITDPMGRVTYETYADGEMQTMTKGNGTLHPATWTYEYDPLTFGITSVTDPLGHTSTKTYDSSGNLLTSTDALGQTTTYTYNLLNERLTTTDPNGVTTTSTYDARGNLLSTSRPLNTQTSSGSQPWAWGDNGNGELGNNVVDPNATSSTPVPVDGPGGSGLFSNATAISGGQYHTLAVDSSGHVWAWGSNGYGQLGNNSKADSSTPIEVLGPDGSGFLSNIVAIAAGGFFSLALDSSGHVWAWGTDADGELGSGTSSYSLTPVEVTGPGGSGVLDNITAISAGQEHSLALDATGHIWTWGFNYYGELGNGTTTGSSTPVEVTGLANVTAVAGGYYHSIALDSSGHIWAWGRDAEGERETMRLAAPVRPPSRF